MHPDVKSEDLHAILNYKPKFFRWAGCDTFNVTTADGRRHVVVIETNSCPSGQKSMPLVRETDESGGYKKLLETTFLDLLQEPNPQVEDGVLAGLF